MRAVLTLYLQNPRLTEQQFHQLKSLLERNNCSKAALAYCRHVMQNRSDLIMSTDTSTAKQSNASQLNALAGTQAGKLMGSKDFF